MEALDRVCPVQGCQTMRAIVQTEYGSPDMLRVAEVERPNPKGNEVLVRVHAASVNAGDWHLMRGTPYLIRLMFGGLRQPKIKTIGSELAGVVEAIGEQVSQFQIGDAVFGDSSEAGFGAFAEYVCAPEDAFVLKPEGMSFEDAAAVPGSALAALQGLRDCGQLKTEQRVLIHGAASGVGSMAVQIAKAFGAEVTGVCRSDKVDMVASLGADTVIDYTQEDVTLRDEQFDLILDVAAFRSFFDYRRILKPGGRYVLVGGSMGRLFQVMILGLLMSRISGRQVMNLMARPNQADLLFLRDLMETGRLKPFVDRCYSLSEVPEAIGYLEGRQVKGKVAIRVS